MATRKRSELHSLESSGLGASSSEIAAQADSNRRVIRRRSSQALDAVSVESKAKLRLNSLENDNWGSGALEGEAELEFGDEPYFAKSKSKRKGVGSKAKALTKSQMIRRVPLVTTYQSIMTDLQQQIVQSEERKEASPIPNYLSATSKPPRFTPLKLCSICGCEAAYTCPVCQSRFCSVSCNQHHKDTRCLKWKA